MKSLLLFLMLLIIAESKIISIENLDLIIDQDINKEKYKNFIAVIDYVCVNGGEYFLDIGANLGYLSFYALSKGMKVIIIEFRPEKLELLSISIRLNPNYQDNIFIYEFGLSDKLKDCYYDSNLELLDCNNKNKNIRFTQLDFLNELPQFDIIHIEALGHEPFIFEGGKDFFTKHRNTPTLLEYRPNLILEQGIKPRDFIITLSHYYDYIPIQDNVNQNLIMY